MINYIRAEIYRIDREGAGKRLRLAFLLIGLGLGVFLGLGKFKGQYLYVLEFATGMLVVIPLIQVFLLERVYTGDRANKTIKNSLAQGLKREEIYLGKIISIVYLSLRSFIYLVVGILLGGLFNNRSFNWSLILEEARLFFMKFMIFMPFIVLTIGLMLFIASHNKISGSGAIFIYYLIYVGLSSGLDFLSQVFKFKFIAGLRPYLLVSDYMGPVIESVGLNKNIYMFLGLSVFYGLIFLGLGIRKFKKMDF